MWGSSVYCTKHYIANLQAFSLSMAINMNMYVHIEQCTLMEPWVNKLGHVLYICCLSFYSTYTLDVVYTLDLYIYFSFFIFTSKRAWPEETLAKPKTDACATPAQEKEDQPEKPNGSEESKAVAGQGRKDDFVSRDQQLRAKKTKKDDRKGKAKAKAKAKAKSGKGTRKTNPGKRKGKARQSASSKKAKGETQSKSAGSSLAKTSRKRQILKSKSKAWQDEDVPAELPEVALEARPTKARRGRKTKASPKSEPLESVEAAAGLKGDDHAEEPKAEAKNTRKRKPRAKKAGKRSDKDDAEEAEAPDLPQGDQAEEQEEDEAERPTRKKSKTANAAKPKGKPKAKAKSRARSAIDSLLESVLRSDTIIKALMDWANQYDVKYEDIDQLEAFKKEVRSNCQPLKKTQLSIYWTKCTCGVFLKPDENGEKVNMHHFGWTSSRAASRHRTAVAVRCAELSVPWNEG